MLWGQAAFKLSCDSLEMNIIIYEFTAADIDVLHKV